MSEEAKKALEEFVNTVDATGGIVRDPKGLYAPVESDEWFDLGNAYIMACKALGRDPYVPDEGIG